MSKDDGLLSEDAGSMSKDGGLMSEDNRSMSKDTGMLSTDFEAKSIDFTLIRFPNGSFPLKSGRLRVNGAWGGWGKVRKLLGQKHGNNVVFFESLCKRLFGNISNSQVKKI
jgi:hypothetical protein